MTRFVEFNILTSYPPSNPNRDREDRMKTAMIGGAPRLRISSQAMKRAMRMQAGFQSDLSGNLGSRTRRIGEIVRDHLVARGTEGDIATRIAAQVAQIFGSVPAPEKDGIQDLKTKQLVFVSPQETQKACDVAERLLAGDIEGFEAVGETLTKAQEKKLKEVLKELRDEIMQDADGAVDIAMFGRMLAGAKQYSRDAAVQVSHACTTHAAVTDDDFFSGMDDLQKSTDPEGSGSAFIDDAEFGSGVFFTYIAVNVDLLVKNLDGDVELAEKGMEALVKALATASPSGKSNSFAHHPWASYIRMHAGSTPPHNLSGAFERPVAGQNLMEDSIALLEDHQARYENAYEMVPETTVVMNVLTGEGRLSDIRQAAVAAVRGE